MKSYLAFKSYGGRLSSASTLTLRKGSEGHSLIAQGALLKASTCHPERSEGSLKRTDFPGSRDSSLPLRMTLYSGFSTEHAQDRAKQRPRWLLKMGKPSKSVRHDLRTNPGRGAITLAPGCSEGATRGPYAIVSNPGRGWIRYQLYLNPVRASPPPSSCASLLNRSRQPRFRAPTP